MKKLFLILKLSILEFRVQKTLFLNVLVILVLGQLAPIVVSSLKSSTNEFLAARSREVLSADISVSGITDFTEKQKSDLAQQIEPVKTASEVQFMTMAQAVSSQKAMLVEVKAIDDHYPLYGSIVLKEKSDRKLNQDHEAWLQRDVLDALDLKVGDQIHLGHADFTVRAEILSDSVLPQGSLNFAPRIYIGKNFISETKLNQFGSQVFYRLFYQLPKGTSNDEIEDLADDLKDSFSDPNIYIRTPSDAIEGYKRFIDFFSRFLSVITIIVFSIAWMSAFYIFQSLNQTHLKQSAIMMTLGASRKLIATIYLLQSFFLNAFSFVIATCLSWVALQILMWQFQSRLPENFAFHLFAIDLGQIFFMSALTGLCFVLTLIAKIVRLKIQILLTESNQTEDKMRWIEMASLNALILTLFVTLSYYLMGSEKFAVGFVLSLVVSSFVSLYCGRLIFAIFRKAVAHLSGYLRILSIHLSRIRFAQSLAFIAIALVAVIINIVPHLLHSLREDIAPIEGHQLPSLFLFNIPEERIGDLKQFAAAHDTQLNFVSPLILARLTRINHAPPKQDFFLKFPVRVSYRKDLIPSEKIVEGEPLPTTHVEGDPIYISIEQAYAERWGIKIGDDLDFDVAGIPFSARVRNLRSVRWSDFNPNFFFEFQTGVLEDAPKTWLADIQTTHSSELENQLVQKFPDVSVVDVRKSVETVTQVVGALEIPAEALSVVSAVISLLILAFVIWHHLISRASEITIMKIMSDQPRRLYAIFVGEYLALAFVALVTGTAGGYAISVYVCQKFLKVEAFFSLKTSLALMATLLLITFIICDFLVRRTLNQKRRI